MAAPDREYLDGTLPFDLWQRDQERVRHYAQDDVIEAGALARLLGVAVDAVESVGWSGDALEAQAFAYLAVRSCAGLPLSFPGTTGVAAPLTGGRLFPR